MQTVFQKMNLKDQSEILVISAPLSFEPEMKALVGVIVHRDPKKLKTFQFALAFATKQSEVDVLSKTLAAKAVGDAMIWFAYPKGTSKKFQCDFNRDTGWDALRNAGFDTVRQIAINEDWSALRFRRTEYIKTTGETKKRPDSKE